MKIGKQHLKKFLHFDFLDVVFCLSFVLFLCVKDIKEYQLIATLSGWTALICILAFLIKIGNVFFKSFLKKPSNILSLIFLLNILFILAAIFFYAPQLGSFSFERFLLFTNPAVFTFYISGFLAIISLIYRDKYLSTANEESSKVIEEDDFIEEKNEDAKQFEKDQAQGWKLYYYLLTLSLLSFISISVMQVIASAIDGGMGVLERFNFIDFFIMIGISLILITLFIWLPNFLFAYIANSLLRKRITHEIAWITLGIAGSSFYYAVSLIVRDLMLSQGDPPTEFVMWNYLLYSAHGLISALLLRKLIFSPKFDISTQHH